MLCPKHDAPKEGKLEGYELCYTGFYLYDGYLEQVIKIYFV